MFSQPLRLFFRQIWIDERLRWDPGEFGGLQTIRIPDKKLWLPDIVLYNK